MRTGKGRRWAALLLCLAMMFSTIGSASPADSAEPSAGLCEHHPEHTTECGYIAPSAGSPCRHVHDESCGYAEAVAETPCDMNCTDTDGDGVIDHAEGCAYTPGSAGSPCGHVHDESCGYAEATEGSPCQFVCDICNAAPDATEAPADSPAPEEPSDTLAPTETPAPAETPAPIGDPGMEGPGLDEPAADGDIMLTALTDPVVTVKKSGDVADPGTGIESNTPCEMEHNQVYQLNVTANYSGVTNGKVKITVAPGLKINSYYQDTSATIDAVKATHSNPEITNYTPYNSATDTLEYEISDAATAISLDVTLAVDTVLWPKTAGWTIDNAIQVEFTGDGESAVTRTANVTVKYGAETSPSWNQLYSSDSNNSVPQDANKPFRMKIFQVSPNLHGSPLGFYYTKLEVTIPLPMTQDGSSTYAAYERVDCSQQPNAQTNVDNTVTFTWNDIYVPAGSAFSFTPYFKWDSQQTAGATVNFSVPGSFKATATPYSGADVSFSINISGGTSQAFTVRGDVAVNFNTGGARTGDVSIFNNGSTDQVYQLGQFQVRNDGFGATGALTLNFTYTDQTKAHVIAQGIPVGSQSGKVTSIKYKTNAHTSDVTETISDGNYRNTDNNRSYMLMAPAGEWFTEITAVIEGLPAQTVCYNPSAGLSPSNGAVTYGTLVNNNTGNFPATLTITGAAVQSPDRVSYTYTSSIVNINKAATQMSVTSGAPFTFGGEATNTVQLGTSEDDRTISYSAVISATTYPYANNQVVERPVIYLRLPDTITVSADDVKLSSVQTGGAENQVTAIDSSHYTFSEEASRGGAGHHVYKIEFNAGDYAGAIGCFNKQLGENQLQLEFKMLADVGIGDVTLKMCETVFVGYADGTPIKASGSLASSQQADKFNVDGDGQTDTQFFSTMTDVDANRLTILAPRIGLTFNSYAKLSDETEYSNYKAPDINPEGLEGKDDIMYLTEDEQTIDFQFTAENKTGAALSISSTELGNEDFYYFIPVPKIGNFWDEAHQHIQDSAFQLDLELTGAVEVSESGGETGLVRVQYSTNATSTNFNSTDAGTISATYQDAAAIGGRWSDVKMIRISVSPAAAGRSFPIDYKATFTIHYQFKLKTDELVGYAVEFGPCGNTRYLRNGEGESGHTPTQRVRAELQTGRIAGRVFIDEDYSGSYTGEKDYFIEFRDSADPETGGGAFLDSDKDGEQDDGEIGVTMDLHAQDASGDVKHYARKPVAEDEAFKNTYEIPSLRAESYTLYIGNPNYTDGEAGEYSLRFIELAAETGEGSRGGSDKLAPASSYGAGYKKTTTAAGITISAADVTDNRMRDIGLQRPHEVTFTVTYEDDHGAPPEKASQTVYVWHGETATAPEIALADDFQLKVDGSTTWTTEDDKATYGQPITSTTREITYTATAVRIPHNVIYDPNGATVNPGSMPDPTPGVNGETVTLDTEHTPSRSDRPGDKGVVFLGWSLRQQDIVGKGSEKKDLGDPDLELVKQVTMDTDGVTVYAVWAEDTNGNNTADVLEDRYTLTYNPNGGSGAPSQVTNLLENAEVTLDEGTSMTHDPDEGTTVLFVGWSESRAGIYGKDDYNNRAEIKSSLKPSVTMESADKTVYAVWAYDENKNGTPDYEEDTHYGVLYEPNGGDTPAELTAAQNTYYLPEMKVILWQPKSTWTKAPQAVFVGWCATNKYGGTPVKTDPSADIITEVTTPAAGGESQSVTVYAVWAEDKNGNGDADCGETQITLQYDKNSGDGAGDFSDMTGLVAGAAYPLADGKGLKRNDPDHPEHPAVFVGWSTVKQDIVPETLKGTVDDLKLVGSSYTIPGDAGSLVTLYAVYGADNNGNGQPDYDESARHVAYYPNGGQKKDGSLTDDATPFYVCNHHHVAKETTDLETADALKVLIERPGAVLIGWSVSPQEVFGGTADAKKAAEAILITEIEIPAEEGTNAQVYAVWAADENGNHEADYNDPHYSQWYYYNAALTDWSPSSEREELNTEDAPRSTVDGNPPEVDKIVYENSTLPASLTDILKDTCIDLPAPVLKARTDLAADGTELHHYVQLGWSGFCHPAATSRTQANLWLIESLDDDLGTPGLQRKIAGSMFQYNFAVWALDENHNGTADFDENPYTLHYDLNGGAGKVPEDEDYLPGEKVELDGTSAPLRTQAIFLGWSLEKHDPATSQADAEAWNATSVTLPEESAQPGKNVVTVYALWAANENAAGDEPDSVTPDYEERHSLTFDPNPMSGGTVSGMPETLTQEYDYGAEVPVPEPTHSDVDGKHVLFVGWSTEKAGLTRAGGSTVYRAGDKVKIGAYDLTLYAQWAFEQTPPAETDAPGRSGSIPWTGDGGHPGIWAALLGLFSAASAGLVLTYKKRRRPDR